MTTARRLRAGRDRPPTARFALTFDDYWRFNRYAVLRTPWLAAYLAALFVIAVAVMVIEAQRHNDAGLAFVRNVTGSAALMAFIAGAVYFRFRGNALKQYVQNPHLSSRTTVTLNPDGVHVENNAGALDVEWRLFRRVAQTRDSIYLFYGLGLATIVPKRAFPSEAEAQAFYEFAREAWEGATVSKSGD